MRLERRILSLVLAIFLGTVWTTGPGAGQTEPDWSLEGGFQLGFRTIDIDGRSEKFQEDFGLEDGPRLFHFNLNLAPPEELRQYFDHLLLNMNNVGGDPFETLRFAVEKYGRYKLQWEQRKSSYFYEDIILPPEFASPELANVGDVHTFDFDRVRDSVSLTLWMSDAARLDVGFDRYTKTGTSTTSYDIERDEFELEREVDESLNEYRAGFSYDWQRTSLAIREHVRKYDNSVEAFLPGASFGGDSEDATVLDFFVLSEPYDLSSYGHALSVVTRPSERFLMKLAAAVEALDLDLDVVEESRGTNYLGEPYDVVAEGAGSINRDLELLDLSASYRLTERVLLVLDASNKSLEQDGELRLDEDRAETGYAIDTRAFEAGVQIAPTNSLTVTAGLREESRKVRSAASEDVSGVEETDHSGVFALIGWHPTRLVSVSARFDSDTYDNPLTLSSPSDRESLRIRARYSRPLGLSLSGTYRLDSLENPDSRWQTEVEHLALRAGYRFALLSLSLGYSSLNTERDSDPGSLIPPESLPWLDLLYPIAYRSDSEVVDARVSWAVNPRLKVGGDVRLYENEGAFALQRERVHVYSEVGFGKGYLAHLGVRQVDYDEGGGDFDDYEARIIELSLGYRWR